MPLTAPLSARAASPPALPVSSTAGSPRLAFLDGADQGNAVHARHGEVCDHGVHSLSGIEQTQRLVPVRRGKHAEASIRQVLAEHLADQHLIIDQQHPRGRRMTGRRRRRIIRQTPLRGRGCRARPREARW